MFGRKALLEHVDDLESRIDRLHQLIEAERRPPVDLSGIFERIQALETKTIPAANREEIEVLGEALAGCEQTIMRLSGQGDTQATQIKDLVHAVAEGIERTARAERRIKSTVRRARKELADLGVEDPAIEEENRQLQLDDVDRSEPEPVQTVPESVADDDGGPSSIPGVSAGVLRRVRYGN